MAGRARNTSPAVSERPSQRGLLIWLSGADPDTLSRSPRESRKFSGLGGVVLTTAGMAGLSAGFALYSGVRAPLVVAVLIAVLWALAIANLDRWLVAAAARRERWWQNLATLLPRVALALVIGAVVSTPLVLWIFQREIQAQLTVTQQAERNVFEQNLRQDARFRDIPELERQVARLQGVAAGTSTEDLVGTDPAVKREQVAFEALDERYSAARDDALCEFDGSCGSRIKGGGSSYRQKVAVMNDLRAQRDAAKSRLEAAKREAQAQEDRTAGSQQANAKTDLGSRQAELARLKDLKTAEEDRYLTDSRNDRGLLAQLEALSTITDSNTTLKTAYLTLLAFITAIEILPVLTKFLLNLGPATAYDQILATAEKSDVQVAQDRLEFDRDQARAELKARAERQEEIRTQVGARETVVQTQIRRRELDRRLSDELRRLSGRPGPQDGGRRTLRFPGPRRERFEEQGYAEWPADESPTRPMNAEPARPAGDPDPGTGGEDTAPRWRFN